MSRRKLNRESALAKTEELHIDINKSFDFPCVNDYCSGRNGKRVNASAWKTDDENGYETFCHMCGQNSKFSKEDFKTKKDEIVCETKNKNPALDQENNEILV